jgi:hypothetical protein
MTKACAACSEGRLHTPAEWEAFHPLAGHGYAEGIGWTHPVLKAANEREEAELPQVPAHSAEPGKGDQ